MIIKEFNRLDKNQDDTSLFIHTKIQDIPFNFISPPFSVHSKTILKRLSVKPSYFQ